MSICSILVTSGSRHALNLLACPPAQGDMQVQAICGIFARLFARFWGPRTEDILRSALATLLCSRRPDERAADARGRPHVAVEPWRASELPGE